MGKNSKHRGCMNVAGHWPIVQNSINGVKVCGKRAKGASLANAVRPIMVDNAYQCPMGYKSCQTPMNEFTMCTKGNGMSWDEDCPITSFAFTLDGMS